MSENTVQYRRVSKPILAMSAASGCVNTLFVILMTIATGVYGASAVLAGTIITGTRLLDAITDPIIGLLSDRMHSRFGRMRPLAILGYILTSGAILLMFVFSPGAGQIGYFVLYYVFYIIGYTIFTVGNNMAGPIITNDPKQRPIFGRWMTVYTTVLSSSISVILAATLMPRHNYQMGLPLFRELAILIIIAAGVLLAITIVAVTIAGADTPDKYVNMKKEKVSIRDMIDLLIQPPDADVHHRGGLRQARHADVQPGRHQRHALWHHHGQLRLHRGDQHVQHGCYGRDAVLRLQGCGQHGHEEGAC